MSYCRFSCDDFRCDLYAFESDRGFTIYVAGRRHVGECPHIDWDGFMAGAIDAQTFADQSKAQHDWLMACEYEPITIPGAGECLLEPDLAAFKARLLDLRELGFRFPEYVLDAVEDETAAEQPADTQSAAL